MFNAEMKIKKVLQVSVTALFIGHSVSVLAAPVVPAEKPVVTVDASKPAHDEKAAQSLIKELESLNSITAHFEQETVSSDGRGKHESGEMQMKRPDLFRWNIERPFKQDIVAQGDKVWMVDPLLKQVIIQKQDARMANTPAQLLSGNAREYLKQYRVSVYSHDETEKYTLFPIKQSDLFDKLDISFRQGVLDQIDIKDAFGGKRRILFSEVKENPKLSDNDFKVMTPKGYEEIDTTKR